MADPTSAAPAAPSSSTPASGGGSAPPPASGGAAPIGAAPAAGGQPGSQVPAPSTRQKWKDTVDGKEVEFEADEAELRATYRKSRAADQRFEQAAAMRKEAESQKRAMAQLQQQFKQDPRSVTKFLKEQGIEDPLDFIANALQAELAEEEKLQDPNVRARVEAERKLQTFEEKQRQQEVEQQTQAFHHEVEESTNQIVQVFDAALKLVDLPADDDTLAIMAQLESENRRRGLNITPERLAAATQERVMARGLKTIEAAVTSGRLSGEKLLSMHPELTKAFNKALIDDFKKRRGMTPASPGTPPAPPKPSNGATRPAAKSEEQLLSEKEAWEKREKEAGRRLLRTI